MGVWEKLKTFIRNLTQKRAVQRTGEKDDALFEALDKNKKLKKRRIIITVTAIVLVLAVVAVVGVSALRKNVRERFASVQGEVLSYTVSTGSIDTVVSGSGSLTDVDMESITVPEGVEITEVLVDPKEAVEKGDILATVDMASVVSALADLQKEIEDLDDQLSDAEGDSASTSVKAGVKGRVKAVFGEKGAEVADVMYENGALALLSLDGYMAVDIETDALAVGDSVKVQLSGEKEVSGTVKSVVSGKATILVTDNGTEYQDTATVLDSNGKKLGQGEMYIHSMLRVTGYAGTISAVNVSLNEKVSQGAKLFSLKNTDYSANYNTLLRSREDLEEDLLQLLTIQRDGALLAAMDGSVHSVDNSEETPYSVVTLSKDEKMSVTVSVDEADILALELGQTVTVTVSSVSEDTFTGTLTEIDRTSSESGTYSAVVELDKVAGMLYGMTADVSVRIHGVEDAVLIPVDALHKTRDGAYVYTSYNEELKEYGDRVDVVTGIENSNYVEIKSGLKPGDTVYYTESRNNAFGFGAMGGFGGMNGMGGMSDFGGMGGGNNASGGGMPDFGSMPDFGGMSGGNGTSGRPGKRG